MDDNAAAREILDDMLEGVVKEADAVASGAEAIAAVREAAAGDPYDVVFMDWRMPGWTACRPRDQEEPRIEPKPAIVMVTAFGREDVREEAERLDLDGFLLKPLTKSMLVDSLVTVFADSSEQAAAAGAASEQGIDLTGMRAPGRGQRDQSAGRDGAPRGRGASVTVADDGKLALDTLIGGPIPAPFDVVLMDLQMPVMDGFQATAAIRADPRFESLPIVAMTAHATLEEKERCLAAGMNDHVAKPIDPGCSTRRSPGSTVVRRAPAPESAARANGPSRTSRVSTPRPARRVAGNERLYLKLLRQFAEQQADAVKEIRAGSRGIANSTPSDSPTR